MGKEAFVLPSINKPEFEKIANGIFSTSLKVRKGTGADWQNRFQRASLAGENVSLQFFSHLGYTLKAPIDRLLSIEYGDELSYDALDLVVRLTPEDLLLIYPPEITTEFGY